MPKPSFLLILSLIFSLGMACFVEQRVFQDTWALNDDIRNQLYWMMRIVSPQLFQQDYIADYFSHPLLVSPVLLGLYSFFALWIKPLVLSQFLPFALVLLATFFLFRFCAAYRNDSYAFWVSFVFNASIWLLKNMAGGLPRAFLYPLFFTLLWTIQTRRWFLVSLTLWLSALIYPPVLILGLGMLIFETIRTPRNNLDFLPKLRCLAISVCGTLALTAWRLLSSPDTSQFGALINAGTAERMRDFYPGGRVVLYTLPYLTGSYASGTFALPIKFLTAILQRLPHPYILIPTLIFCLLIWLYGKFLKKKLGPLEIPPLIWNVLPVSGLLYILAWLLLFYLYVPERYLEYTLLLIPSFFLGGLVYTLQKNYPRFKHGIAAGFIFLTLIGTGFFWRDDLMDIPEPEKNLYRYLKKLPESVMLVAPPGLASNIPVYAARSVLLSNEAYVPFHQAYFQEMKSRLKDWLSAYYALDRAPLLLMINKYHIDYVILQTKDFQPKRFTEFEQRYYHAFDPRFFSALKHEPVSRYYLMKSPEICMTYSDASFRVFKAKCILEQAAKADQK